MKKEIYKWNMLPVFWILTCNMLNIWPTLNSAVWMTGCGNWIKLEARAREMSFIHTISTKVVAKNSHATIPKGNMGSMHSPWHWSCRTYFCCFPLAFANIHVSSWPLVPFFQISLKNSELKTTLLLGLLHDFFQHLSRKSGIQKRDRFADCAEVIFSAFTRIHKILL